MSSIITKKDIEKDHDIVSQKMGTIMLKFGREKDRVKFLQSGTFQYESELNILKE